MKLMDHPLPASGTVFPGAVATTLMGDGRLLTDPRRLVDAYAQALRADGIPVERIFVVVPTLHPQTRALSIVWNSDGRPVQEIARQWNLGPEFLASPLARIADGSHAVIRRRLLDRSTPRDYAVLRELDEQGCTDYVLAAIPMANEQKAVPAISFATRAPAGFSDEQLARALASIQLLAPILECAIMRRIAGTLLNVYLGADAGARVLDGAVRRGDGEAIHAAVCFTDLRDFTSLSDRLPRADLLELLNAYFDCVVTAVERNGGEVLKFVGDAVLSVFRASTSDEGPACRAALQAGRDAFAAASEANLARTEKTPIDFGMSIHVGDVMYGNIGGANRLDFTVIGPAVNVASRIQGLCRALGHPLLVSEQFVAATGADCEDLGAQSLKGVAQPLRIFSPR